MRQRELEIRLERTPPHPRPSPDLEQYRTPAPVAADVLYRALGRGDIRDRNVVDLGCGTGMFLLGAGLLGARRLTGIDIDAVSIDLTRQTLQDASLEADLRVGPVETLDGAFDTAVMNPPFGAQFAQRHADSLFVQHALRVAPVCYSLHLEETARHLERLAGRLQVDFERLTAYDLPIPHLFHFHRKDRHLVPVALYRFERRPP